MIVTRKHIPRRTFLRGMGAVIALPALDAMTPAFAAPRAGTSPLRLAFTYVPNGITMTDWTPHPPKGWVSGPHACSSRSSGSVRTRSCFWDSPTATATRSATDQAIMRARLRRT